MSKCGITSGGIRAPVSVEYTSEEKGENEDKGHYDANKNKTKRIGKTYTPTGKTTILAKRNYVSSIDDKIREKFTNYDKAGSRTNVKATREKNLQNEWAKHVPDPGNFKIGNMQHYHFGIWGDRSRPAIKEISEHNIQAGINDNDMTFFKFAKDHQNVEELSPFKLSKMKNNTNIGIDINDYDKSILKYYTSQNDKYSNDDEEINEIKKNGILFTDDQYKRFKNRKKDTPWNDLMPKKKDEFGSDELSIIGF